MCSSYVECIPPIIHAIAAFKPKSVLDIGMGNGKYGFLIREYFYEREPGSLGTWPYVPRVDGYDVWEGYTKPHHAVIYNKVTYGNALEMEPDPYDLYLMIDVLEHWPKDKAKELIRKCLKHGAVLISTPKDIGEQGASHGNEWERHITQWYAGDFEGYNVLQDRSQGYPSLIYLFDGHSKN